MESIDDRYCHVAPMPNRGKRGKDVAILQIGRDAYRKNFGKSGTAWVATKLFLRTQVWWWHEAKSPTRHSIRADPDALRRLLAPSGGPELPALAPMLGAK
jgi:hypothetical protein